MEKEKTPSSISERVLDKIRANEISMRPRAYFALQTIALGFVALVALLASVSIGTFILFSIRASNTGPLLGFGPPGYVIFLQLFPWPLLLLDIACIGALEWMLRKFRFGYKSPFLYLLGGIIVVSLAVALTLDQSRASDQFLRGAHDHDIPGIGGLYDQGRRPPPPGSGACPCTITAINPASVSAEEDLPDGTHQAITVILPPGFATSTLQVGGHYFILGHTQNNVFYASEVHPFQPDGDTGTDDEVPSAYQYQ